MSARRLPALVLARSLRDALFVLLLAGALLLFRPAHAASTAPPPPTLLDEVGHLAPSVPAPEVAAWKRLLHQPQLAKEEADRLHLWLGEYTLAHDENPELARWHFQHISPASSATFGLGQYDSAITFMTAPSH